MSRKSFLISLALALAGVLGYATGAKSASNSTPKTAQRVSHSANISKRKAACRHSSCRPAPLGRSRVALRDGTGATAEGALRTEIQSHRRRSGLCKAGSCAPIRPRPLVLETA